MNLCWRPTQLWKQHLMNKGMPASISVGNSSCIISNSRKEFSPLRKTSTLKNELARAPKSHNPVRSAPIGPRPASATAARRSYALRLCLAKAAGHLPLLQGNSPILEFFYKTKPTSGATSSNIASKIICGSRSRRIPPGRRQDHEHTHYPSELSGLPSWPLRCRRYMMLLCPFYPA